MLKTANTGITQPTSNQSRGQLPRLSQVGCQRNLLHCGFTLVITLLLIAVSQVALSAPTIHRVDGTVYINMEVGDSLSIPKDAVLQHNNPQTSNELATYSGNAPVGAVSTGLWSATCSTTSKDGVSWSYSGTGTQIITFEATNSAGGKAVDFGNCAYMTYGGSWANRRTYVIVPNPNSTPVASNSSKTLNEDGSAVIAANFTDADSGDTHTITNLSQPGTGSVSVSGLNMTYTPPANWSGSTSFTYKVKDNNNATSGTATVSITVNAVNDAPVAGAMSFSTNEDTAQSKTVSVSDVDDSSGFTAYVVSQPSTGTGSVAVSGLSYTYTPPANWSGSTSFSYRVKDDGGKYSATKTASVTVSAVNDAPVAATMSFNTNEDTAQTKTVSITDVDDSSGFTAYIVSQPTSGTGAVSLSGLSYTYTPPANWSGTTSFTYRVKDDGGKYSATKTASVTVNAVNDAPVAGAMSFSTDEDTAETVTVTATDIDDTTGFTGEVVSQSSSDGSVSVSGMDFTFTPAANWSGTTSFTYRVSDDGGANSATKTASVTVTAVNDAPVTGALSFSTDEDAALVQTVVVTDVDDSSGFTAYVVAQPDNGTVTVSGLDYTYTPPADWSGSTSFTYRVKDDSDAYSATKTATVTVTAVNDAPVAGAMSFSTDEDTAQTQTVSITDVDDTTGFTAYVVADPDNGSVSISGLDYTYTPPAGWSGTTSFTYRVQDDGGLYSATKTASVTVNAVNDAPVAGALSFSTDEDTAETVTVTATDIDDTTGFTGEIVTQPSSGGSVTVSGMDFTFTPAADWNGTTSFTYRVSDDGGANSATKTASVTVNAVNDAPVAGALSFSTDEDTALTQTMSVADVDDTTGFVASVVAQPDNGTVTLSGLDYTYTPPANWNGTTSFTYRVKDDSDAYSATKTATITVTAVNDAPVAGTLTFSTDEDTAQTKTVSVTDLDDTTGFTAYVVADPDNGSVSISGLDYTYTPPADWSGTTSFTYHVQDAGGLYSATKTASVTVNAVNDAPVAGAMSFSTDEDTAQTVTVTATDVDDTTGFDGEIVTQPTSGGSVTVTGMDFKFTPAADWNGTTSFTYRVTDAGGEQSATRTASVTVTAVNDAPVASAVTFNTSEDIEQLKEVLVTDPDAGDTHTLHVVAQPGSGSVAVSGMNLIYTPPANWSGSTSFTYRVKDSVGVYSTSKTASVTVTAVNDSPVAGALSYSTDEDTTQTQTLTVTDADDTTGFVASVVVQPDNGTVTVSGLDYTYTPPADWSGTTSFTYRVADDEGAYSATETASVTVTAVNDAPVAGALSYTTDEDTAETQTLSVSDVDDTTGFTASIVAQPDNGAVAVDGLDYTYTPPADWSGTTTFTYRVADDDGAYSATETASVTVNAINDAPIAGAMNFSTDEDTAQTITVAITDVDDTTGFTAYIVAQPTTGTGAVTLSGTDYTYTPPANWSGTTSFTYRVKDDSGDYSATETASVTVNAINDAPVAGSMSFSTDEDTAQTVTVTASDVDDSTGFVGEIVTQPSSGGAVSVSGMDFTFTPAEDWSGYTSFTYRVSDDGGASSATKTASVTVAAVNDAPVAGDLSFATDEDTPQTQSLTITDVDDTTGFVASVVALPDNGTVTISGEEYTYTPPSNWSGTTSFTYRVKDDGDVYSATKTATVTVNAVNDAPVAGALAFNTNEDTAETLIVAISDVDDNTGFTAHIVAQPSEGAVTVSGQNYTYTPPENWSGATSFTYRVKDDGGLYSETETATVTVIAVNDAPVAGDLTFDTDEDTAETITITATDVDDTTGFVGEIVTQPTAGGTVSVSGMDFTFTPSADWNGITSFTYLVSDGGGANSETKTASVTVNAVNDAPVAGAVAYTTSEDVAETNEVTVTDPDTGDTHTLHVVAQPGSGSVAVSGMDLTYTPAANWSGTTSFTYRVKDSVGAYSATETASVTVTAVNDAPVAGNIGFSTDEDTAQTVTLSVTDVDDTTGFVASVVDQPSNGTVTISGLDYTYTPPENWSGTTTFTYRVKDASGAYSTTETATVTVNAVNDEPVAGALNFTTDEDTAQSQTVTISDVDDTTGFTAYVVDQPTDGSVSVSGLDYTYTPPAHWSGTTTFTYWVQDDSGAYSALETATVTVNAVNDPPVAGDLSFSTDEDTAQSLTLTATDVDDTSGFVGEIVSQPTAGGTVSVSGMDFTFTPNENWNGTTSFTYRVQDDGSATSETKTASVTVNAVNDAPVAGALSFTTEEDTAQSETVSITDVDDTAGFRAHVVDQPAYGTVTIADLDYTYTPPTDWNGSTTFTYRVEDNSGLYSTTKTASVTVNAVNDAPVAGSLSFITDEDTAQSQTLTITDVDDSSGFTAYVVTEPSNGTVSVSGLDYTYTPPADWNGATSFTYRVKDEGGLFSTTETALVTVNAVNDAPVAGDMTFNTDEDTPATITVTATDIDDTSGFVGEIVSQPSEGGAVTVSGMDFTFSPSADWNGTTSFTYRVKDDGGLYSAAKTASITVAAINDAPVAGDLSFSTDEDTPETVTVTATDVDDTTGFSGVIVSQPTAGGAVSVSGMDFTFTPTEHWNGTTSFTYQVQDAGGLFSVVKTANVTVSAVNDAPVAGDLSFTTDEDTALSQTVTITDVDDTTGFTAYVVESPASGSVSVSGLDYTYTPSTNWSGTSSFTYRVQDDGGQYSETKTANITVAAVNDAPVAGTMSFSTDEDTPETVTVSATDVDDTAGFTGVIVSQPEEGGAVTVSGMDFTFTPTEHWNGTSSFTYQVKDDGGASSVTKTASITVTAVNDAPDAGALSFSTDEDTPLTQTLSVTDVDDSTGFIASVVEQPGSGGTVTISGLDYTFTPIADWHGTTSFTYRVKDDGGAYSSTETATVTVNAVNDAPVASVATFETSEDTAQTQAIAVSDPDTADSHTLYVVGEPSEGAVVVSDMDLIYTPPLNWSGTTSFTYRVKDSAGAYSATETANVTVIAVNDAPVAGNLSFDTDEDTEQTQTVSVTDVDDTSDFTGQVVSQPSEGGEVSVSGLDFVYTPSANWSGTTTFTYRVSDAGGAYSATKTALITVNAVNDAPVAGALSFSTDEDTALTQTLSVTDVDDSTGFVASVVEHPANGSVAVSGLDYTYTPPVDWNGSTSFTYRVADDDGIYATTLTATVTVNAVDDAPVVSVASFETAEDTDQAKAVVVTDPDFGDSHTLHVVAQPDNGVVTISGLNLSYSPAADWYGSTSFTYRVMDSTGLYSATKTANITVTAVNDAPSAGALTFVTDEDVPQTSVLLVSDVDDASGHTAYVTAQPGSGELTVSGLSYTYTPPAHWNGTTSFTYRVQDPGGLYSTTRTASVTVNAVNDAPVAGALSFNTNEDTAQTQRFSVTDVDDTADFIASVVSHPDNGSVTISGLDFIYTPPADWSGTTSFTYRVADDDGAYSSTLTASVTVEAVNDAPLAGDLAFSTDEDVSQTLTLTVTDVDNASGHVGQVVTQPESGDVTVSGVDFTYLPPQDWYGTTTFTYRVLDPSDGVSDTKIATVTVVPVNDAPRVETLNISTLEDAAITATAVVIDPDADESHTVVLVTTPSATVGALTAAGLDLTFTPAQDWNGTASYTYKVRDNAGAESAVVTGVIEAIAVNDAPVAGQPMAFDTLEDVAQTLTALVTDVDNTDSELVVEVQAQPNIGDVTIDGLAVTYTPPLNWFGETSFTYLIKDIEGAITDTVTAQVSVTEVLEPPIADPLVINTDEDIAQASTVTYTDPDDSGGVFAELIGSPANGQVTLSGLEFTYTPDQDFNGSDTFAYTLSDASGATSEVQTATVEVAPVNDAPVSQDVTVNAVEDTAITFAVPVTDPDAGDAHSFTMISSAMFGDIASDGLNVTYTPDPDRYGADIMTFSVVDAAGAESGEYNLNIFVEATNDAPTGTTLEATVDEDSVDNRLRPRVFDVDTLSDTEYASVVVTSDASHGSVTVVDDEFAYTPVADYFGVDTFEYVVTDSGGETVSGVANLTVTNTGDAPVLAAVSALKVPDHDSASVKIELASDADLPDDAITLSIRIPPAAGTASLMGDTLTYVAASGFFGADELVVRATDRFGLYNDITVAVDVFDFNIAPSEASLSIETDEDLVSDLTAATVVDPDIDDEGKHVFSVVTQPTYGTVQMVGNRFEYTPDPDFNGADSFSFRAEDTAGASVIGTASVVVNPKADKPTKATLYLEAYDNIASEPAQPIVADPDINAPGDTFTFAIDSTPIHGNVKLNGSNFVYTPAPNYLGKDSFTYTVTDSYGLTLVATAEVNVLFHNDAPTATSVEISTMEDRASYYVAPEVTDPDEGDKFTFSVITGPENGTIEAGPMGLRFIPNPNYFGTETFTYRAIDAGGLTVTGTGTVIVRPVNDAPSSVEGTIVTTEDTDSEPTAMSVIDVDDDIHSIALASKSGHGTVIINEDYTVTYVPDAEFNGEDSFLVRAADPDGLYTFGEVSVTVTPLQDAPRAVSGTVMAFQGQEHYRLDIVVDDPDEGDTFSVIAVSASESGTRGTVALSDGVVTYTAPTGYEGSDSFDVMVEDSAGNQLTGSLDVRVDEAFHFVATSASHFSAMQTHELIKILVSKSRGPDCRFVTSLTSSAREEWLCLVEFVVAPDGLEARLRSNGTELRGGVSTPGEHEITYTVTARNRFIPDLELQYSGTQTLTVFELPTPEQYVKPELEPLPDGSMSVDIATGIAGLVTGSAPIGSLAIDVQHPGGTDHVENNRGFSASRSKLSHEIVMDYAPLWSQREITVKTSYVEHPDNYIEETYNTVVVPPKRIYGEIELPTEILDTEALTVKIRMGEYKDGRIVYDGDRLGQWKATFGRVVSGGKFEPILTDIEIVDGYAQVTQSFADIESSRYAAEFELVSPIEGYSRKFVSRPGYMTVLRGGALDSNVSARRVAGPAPFSSIVQVATESRMDKREIGGTSWFFSDDGIDWHEREELSGRTYFSEVFGLGSTFVKAEVVNRNDGTVYETQPVEFVGYYIPKVDIVGPRVAFIGGDITLSAEATLNGLPIDAVIEWDVNGSGYNTEGKSITLSSDVETNALVKVRARSPAALPGDRYAYDFDSYRVIWKPVKAPYVVVNSDSVMESGVETTFTARVVLPYNGMEAETDGFWTLPDGSTVSGSELLHNPDPTTNLSGQERRSMLYTAWVVGYRESGAELTYERKFTVWDYLWPDWSLSSRFGETVAPTRVTVDMRPINKVTDLEDLQYQWTLPAEAVLVDDRETSKVFDIMDPGDYSVSVTVTDARGNTVTKQKDFTLTQAEPYSMTVSVTGDNELMREPVSLLVRPYVDGGHPDDRVASFDYYVNGLQIDADSASYTRTTLLEGVHTIEVTMNSEMGETVTVSKEVTVIDNQIPTCEPTYTEGSTDWLVYATCTDIDGRIKRYAWTADGVVLNVTSGRATLSKASFPGGVIVGVTGVDDSGESSEVVEIELQAIN